MMVVMEVLSLQVFVPRQFARVGHSVNMVCVVKENHVDLIPLNNCGKSHT